MPDYSRMTHDEFVEMVEELLGEMSPGEILQIPGAWEPISEHLNNDALDRWAAKQQAGSS
jgi:hypothetical protein